MKTKVAVYPIYDLANEHFRNVQLVTRENKTVNGRFVKFKVAGDLGDNVFPAEKYCFLPVENETEFRFAFKINKGRFDEFPSYILQLGLHEIKRITIEPVLAL